MGKKLLFAFLISFGFAASAQNILIKDTSDTVVNGDTVTFTQYYRSGGQTAWDHKKFVTVTNNTNDTMVLNMSRLEVQTIAGSYDFYCFGQTCLGAVKAGVEPFRTSADTVRVDPAGIAAGDSPFTVYLDSATSGVAIYKYEFSDKLNPFANTESFFIRWIVKNVTSLEENKLNSEFSIYPNPAESIATLNFNKELNFNRQEIQMFNILGESVYTATLKKGTKTYDLNVEDLPKGIYFVNVVADGARVSSKKMIVK